MFHVNRKFTFTNRTDYLQFLNKSFALKPEQIVYLDSSSERRFFSQINTGEVSEYFGSFINDSVEIKKSAFLKENVACIGRILREIDAKSGSIADSLLGVNNTMKQFRLWNAKTDQQLDLNSDRKVKVFLLYSYGFGTYFNSLYKDIAEVSKNKSDNLSVYIISLDPVRFLH
jgi:hypothetical protein